MENDKNLAHVAKNLDETQIVSLQDLEELERLQLTGGSELDPVKPRQFAFPFSVVFGVLLALLLVAVLVVGYVHERSAARAVQTGSRGQ